MHPLDLKEIIFEGESTIIEFKRKFTTSEKIAKEISALANTKGGYLIIGVEDNGSIYGVTSEKGEIENIEKVCNFFIRPSIVPEIEIVELFGKDIIVVSIEESKQKPHRVIKNPDDDKSFGIAYIRVGEQSVTASREMTKILEGMSMDATPLKLSIGENEKRLLQFIERHKKATVKDFTKLCNISKRRASQLIVRLVRVGVLHIHQDATYDYFTLVDVNGLKTGK